MTKFVPLFALTAGIVVGLTAGRIYYQTATPPETHKSAAHTADHKMIDVDTTKPIPELQLKAYADSMAGVNLQIITQNYKFTPEKVNTANVDNEGHAHLLINGEKLARVYADWFHIPADKLVKGENIITVTLNANDHSEWAYRGDHIQAQTKLTVQ